MNLKLNTYLYKDIKSMPPDSLPPRGRLICEKDGSVWNACLRDRHNNPQSVEAKRGNLDCYYPVKNSVL